MMSKFNTQWKFSASEWETYAASQWGLFALQQKAAQALENDLNFGGLLGLIEGGNPVDDVKEWARPGSHNGYACGQPGVTGINYLEVLFDTISVSSGAFGREAYLDAFATYYTPTIAHFVNEGVDGVTGAHAAAKRFMAYGYCSTPTGSVRLKANAEMTADDVLPQPLATSPAFSTAKLRNPFQATSPSTNWGWNDEYGHCPAEEMKHPLQIGISPHTSRDASRTECAAACLIVGTSQWIVPFAGNYDGNNFVAQHWYSQHEFLEEFSVPSQMPNGCPAAIQIGDAASDVDPEGESYPRCTCFTRCGDNNDKWVRGVFDAKAFDPSNGQ